ncbi:MAG: oligosaccharide flippase family protein [Planctomycetes bacterium]|nr:oligosaccharide flippase family protein [Planctomycetota bacterium]MBU4398688.1 oligosaccharide flippase family protein [Planctomycetota bacterium]MCG2684269.1 oligosaccharide flippase family protein [Planctomycetales bacterium]
MTASSGKQRSFSGDVLRFFSANIFHLVVGVATSVLIARVLGPTGRGAASLLILVPMLLATGLSLGIHQANVYFVDPKRHGLGVVMTNSTLLIAVVSIFAAPLMWLAENWIVAWLKLEDYRIAYRWACVLLPVMLANMLYVNVLVGQKRFTERNINVVILSIVQLVLAVVLVWLLATGVAGWIAVMVTANLLSTAFIVIRLKGFNWRTFARPNKAFFRESMVFGLKGQVGNLLQMFNYRLDMFVVNYFLGLNAVGIYTIAVRIAELPWMMPQVVGNVLFAMTSGDQDKYNDKYVASSARKTTVMMIVSSTAILATGWFVVPLVFGYKFADSVLPLVILVPSSIGVGIHKVLMQALMGKGHPQYMSYTAAIALGVTITLDIILIPLWGVPGAAAASTIAYLVCATCTICWYTRESGLRWHEFVVPRREDWRYIFKQSRGVVRNLMRPRLVAGK